MKNLKIIIIFIFLLLPVFVYAEEKTEIIEVTGYSFIADNNIAKARDEAINNAKIQALERVCGVFVKQRVTAEKYDILKNKIDTFTDGYIKNYDVINEQKEDEDNYSVLIKAEVVINNIGEISDDGRFYIKDGVLTFYLGADSEITIPDNVISIGYEAFKNCDSIEKIIFSDKIKYIEDRAFIGCKNLRDFILPNSLISIGNESFADCEKLTNINLPKSLNKLGKKTFFNCKNLNKIKLSDKMEEIPEYCFKNTKLGSVTIPKNVEVIGDYAFQNCSTISEINLNDGLMYIGICAFDCDENTPNENLDTIIIPKTCEIIRKGAFRNCINVSKIIINSGVKEIGNVAFGCDKPNYSCNSLFIPKTVKTIGDSAFFNYSSLQTLVFECERGETVEESRGVEYIGEQAFCCYITPNNSLRELIIPKTVETIGNYAFFNYCNIEKLVIEWGVKQIGDYAFGFGADKVILNDYLKELLIPSNIQYIGKGAFMNYTMLEKLTFADDKSWWNKTYIDEWAFGCVDCSNTRLKEIIFPSNIGYVGDYAFNNMKNLRFIKFKNKNSSIELDNLPFSGCNNVETVIFEAGGENMKIKNLTFEGWLNKHLKNFMIGGQYLIKDQKFMLDLGK